MAFEASALERLTRGFISITTMSPFSGLTANWMLEPPVSTPMRRMQAKAASRIFWYSTSDNVWAGATVMESPVWTPIGSKFSIEHTTTQLSALVAHDLELEFLPARDRSLDEDLGDGAGVEADGGDVPQLVGVGRDAGTGAAQDVGGPHDDGIADLLADDHRLIERVGESRRGNCQADLGHGGLELLAILGGGDGFGVGPDELDTETLKDAPLDTGHGQVERGLAAEGRQHCVRPFTFDDGGHDIGRERLDVGAIGHLGVGHDRGRVGVDEDDAVALAPKHPARLRPRVVELAGLADHDRPRSDHQDRLDVISSGHGLRPPPFGLRDYPCRAMGAPTPSPCAMRAGRKRVASHFDISSWNWAKRYSASWGPGPASGWYCTLNAGMSRQRRPSMTPSFRLRCVMSTLAMESSTSA